jgi:non-canonical (house-cleaning) NTP pyrophosphatase
MTDLDRMSHMVQLITQGRPLGTVMSELKEKGSRDAVTDVVRLSHILQLITRGRPLGMVMAGIKQREGIKQAAPSHARTTPRTPSPRT